MYGQRCVRSAVITAMLSVFTYLKKNGFDLAGNVEIARNYNVEDDVGST